MSLYLAIGYVFGVLVAYALVQRYKYLKRRVLSHTEFITHTKAGYKTVKIQRIDHFTDGSKRSRWFQTQFGYYFPTDRLTFRKGYSSHWGRFKADHISKSLAAEVLEHERSLIESIGNEPHDRQEVHVVYATTATKPVDSMLNTLSPDEAYNLGMRLIAENRPTALPPDDTHIPL